MPLRYRLGKAFFEMADSRRRIAAVVVVCAAAAGLLDYAVNYFLTGYSVTHNTQRLINASVVGSAIGLVTLLIFLGARERRRRLLEDLRKVAELNHQVRNALQVVVYSQFVPQSLEQRQAVMASVERIDKTLRELFPLIGQRKFDSSLEHPGERASPLPDDLPIQETQEGAERRGQKTKTS